MTPLCTLRSLHPSCNQQMIPSDNQADLPYKGQYIRQARWMPPCACPRADLALIVRFLLYRGTSWHLAFQWSPLVAVETEWYFGHQRPWWGEVVSESLALHKCNTAVRFTKSNSGVSRACSTSPEVPRTEASDISTLKAKTVDNHLMPSQMRRSH